MAANQGNKNAQYELGECYNYGKGVVKDYHEAVKWYYKAAIQEHEGAQYKLGECYNYGIGVVKDCHEAIKWYSKAADNGVPMAKKSC